MDVREALKKKKPQDALGDADDGTHVDADRFTHLGAFSNAHGRALVNTDRSSHVVAFSDAHDYKEVCRDLGIREVRTWNLVLEPADEVLGRIHAVGGNSLNGTCQVHTPRLDMIVPLLAGKASSWHCAHL